MKPTGPRDPTHRAHTHRRSHNHYLLEWPSIIDRHDFADNFAGGIGITRIERIRIESGTDSSVGLRRHDTRI